LSASTQVEVELKRVIRGITMSAQTNDMGSGNGSSVVVSGITKLNGRNFRTWKEMISILLRLRGISKAVSDDDVDEMIDLQAKLALLEAMDESHRS